MSVQFWPGAQWLFFGHIFATVSLMDEQKHLLGRILELTEENNAMLHKMRRAARWSRLIHIFYWVLIIGSAIGTFYFVQPFIDQFLEIYGNINGGIGNFLK